MPTFLLELFFNRSDLEAVAAGAQRAERAAAELSAEGRSIHYMRSLFVPADETCFYLYEAGSVADVRAAAVRAGLPSHRIVEAITSTTAAANPRSTIEGEIRR